MNNYYDLPICRIKMDKLLIRYCSCLNISIEDFKSDSHANGLPTYRHIFYYRVKNSFPNVKLWQIAAITNKKNSGISYGIKKIENLITPIMRTGSHKAVITPEMQLIKNHVISFLNICREYKESDLRLPKK